MRDAAVTLEVLFCGTLPSPRGYVFRAAGSRLRQLRSGLGRGGGIVRLPCLAFVVRHPTAGVLLVDTGFPPELVARGADHFGLPLRIVFRALRPEPTPFDVQLRDRGIDPATVERVVMTHLHGDHTAGMRLLPNARFLTTVQERRFARGRAAAVRGVARRDLPGDDRLDVLDLERDGVPFGPFARTHDLLGDGSVRLLSTPGHTPGHLSVLLRTADRGPVLLAGDAAYTLRSIADRHLPLMTDDDDRARTSLEALRRWTREHPGGTVIPTHDPDAWRTFAAAA